MSKQAANTDRTISTSAVLAAVTLFVVVLAAVVIGEMTMKALLFAGGLMTVLVLVKGAIESNP